MRVHGQSPTVLYCEYEHEWHEHTVYMYVHAQVHACTVAHACVHQCMCACDVCLRVSLCVAVSECATLAVYYYSPARSSVPTLICTITVGSLTPV